MKPGVLTTELNRRSFVGAGLALAGTSILPLPALAAATRAIPARKFFDSVGICTHPNWNGTLWQTSDWEAAFLETGVKNTRGKIGSGDSGQAALVHLQKLFSQGVKICVTVADQDAGLDRAGTRANIDFLATRVGTQNISGIESVNEYSNPSTRPADWANQLREFHKWLYATVRARPALNNVPVIAPSMWGRQTNDYITLGNLEPSVDRGCLHWYTGGRRPTRAGMPGRPADFSYSLADAIREAKVLAPTKPLWITECGHPIAGPGTPLSSFTITEKAAAKYMIRGLLDGFGEGVEKMNIYALIDDVHRQPPRYHGLTDGTLKRRLTFHAVKNLMVLFRDSGTLTSGGTLDFTLGNATATIKRQLFQKSDRTFLLTMYQDVDSYNRTTLRDTVVAPVTVRLNLAQPAAKIEVFTPTLSQAVKQSVSNAKTLAIPVGDHVTVVKITPTGAALSNSDASSEATSAEPAPDPFGFKVPPED
jgi:hypothetical protein